MDQQPWVVEHPLVPKRFIIETYQPGVPTRSDSPLRSLQEKGLATAGVDVRLRPTSFSLLLGASSVWDSP